MGTEKKKIILIFGDFKRVIPTISYNPNHTKGEEPEEEASREPQEYHEHPTEEHGDSQATGGKKCTTNTVGQCAKQSRMSTARRRFFLFKKILDYFTWL